MGCFMESETCMYNSCVCMCHGALTLLVIGIHMLRYVATQP